MRTATTCTDQTLVGKIMSKKVWWVQQVEFMW